LVVTLLVVVAIFRVRAYVAASIRGLDLGGRGWIRRLVPQEFAAEAGPYLLAAWVVLQYLAWALRIPGGQLVLTRGALVTILAVTALRALDLVLDRTLLARRQAAAAPPEGPEGGEPEQVPPPAGRRLAAAALRVVCGIVAAGVILEAWGIDVGGWLGSAAGREVVARAARVAVVTALAGLLWYSVDRVARRYITAEDAEGNLVHDNRTRTLANIVRNLALITAMFMVAGHLLAAVGVNPTALLAGAGVVGFAIGFGSQKLVQDLTTGLFILLGDTIRVGDVVRLGDRSGVVEAVSIRTVTLRDYNGDVHTVPYSSISIVTNMTKDYSFAVFNVAVGYAEDVDRIVEVLREVDTSLRREWPYRRLMLEPLDLAGLDAFTDKGVVVVARSKTRAGEQWKVAREFNRRLKRRFDELGIDFPYPHQTVQVAEPPQARAGVVPLHLQPRPAAGAAPTAAQRG
jgi:small conductance mechanosensitive channel